MRFEKVLAAVIGAVFGFGLLSQVSVPAATAAPATSQVVVDAPLVSDDDPWH